MTAAQKNQALASRINQRLRHDVGPDYNIVTNDDAEVLRLAERALQLWAEGECGDSNSLQSWSIERDEATNKPCRVTRPHRSNSVIKTPIQDREASALRATTAVCRSLGLHFYHQTDPRGASLYVSNEPLNDMNYTNGIACSV